MQSAAPLSSPFPPARPPTWKWTIDGRTARKERAKATSGAPGGGARVRVAPRARSGSPARTAASRL
jgi:hypothetical protein